MFCCSLFLGMAIVLIGETKAGEPVSEYVRKTSSSDTVIVFVHGFRGNSVATWSNGDTYWPRLLTQDHTFDGADVFVYEYQTGLSATLSIDELAENMRAAKSQWYCRL